ncbi:MAG: class I SAM-dependent methyltransferase [Gammaproteobacteria bacterium]|jgi:16S rRNA (guanine1516-N2)-methyltransferase
MNSSSICIVCTDDARRQQAQALARQTGLPLLGKKCDDFSLQLCFDHDRVALIDTALDTSIHVDFVSGALAHRQQFGGGRGQAIAKAAGLKQGKTPSVLDITAGLARDAYILASLGCKLTLVEQSTVLYALIEDGIERGQHDAASADTLRNFTRWINTDAVEYMQHINEKSRPAVIYIDPMYPERKKSALVKKDMQILQRLLGKDQNAGQLLITALERALERVIVKRPAHADALGNIKPDTSIYSKKTRYDVYLVKNSH